MSNKEMRIRSEIGRNFSLISTGVCMYMLKYKNAVCMFKYLCFNKHTCKLLLSILYVIFCI